MKEVSASPSSIPESPDYEDYDDEDVDDVVQPVDKDDSSNNSEFLFLQPTDTRLMLEDDDDSQPGIIKVGSLCCSIWHLQLDRDHVSLNEEVTANTVLLSYITEYLPT